MALVKSGDLLTSVGRKACISADQLVILGLKLHLSTRNLAESLWINIWSDQKLSGCAWTLMVARLSMSINNQPRNSHYQLFQCSHILVFMLVIFTASTLTGVIITPVQMEYARLTRQPRKIFSSYATLKMPLASSLVPKTASNWTDVRWKNPLVQASTIANYGRKKSGFSPQWAVQASARSSGNYEDS